MKLVLANGLMNYFCRSDGSRNRR